MAEFQRIVVATDFSEASDPAFSKAVDLARACGAKLTVVHVLPGVEPVGIDGYMPVGMYETMKDALIADARSRLDAQVKRADEAGVRSEGRLLEGIPAEQIVLLAGEQQADLVVLGTHGRHGLARVFMGSVATRVVSTAACPVLTVRFHH